MNHVLIGLGSVLAVAACGGSIDATRYDQSCAQATDCVAVYSGPLCQVCGGCVNAAINVSAKASYDADARAIAASCPPRLGTTTVACGACYEPMVQCLSGTCAVAAP